MMMIILLSHHAGKLRLGCSDNWPHRWSTDLSIVARCSEVTACTVNRFRGLGKRLADKGPIASHNVFSPTLCPRPWQWHIKVGGVGRTYT